MSSHYATYAKLAKISFSARPAQKKCGIIFINNVKGVSPQNRLLILIGVSILFLGRDSIHHSHPLVMWNDIFYLIKFPPLS